MDQQTVNKLQQLKELLDGGILSQEEFDAEKKSILEYEEQSTPPQKPLQPFVQTKSSLNRWWLVCAAIFLCVILVLCLKNCGGNDVVYYDDITDSVDVEECSDYLSDAGERSEIVEAPPIEINPDQFIQEGSDEDFEINCPWRKEYFHNDFGEDMYEHPYIATTIGGSWNSEIVYSNEIGFRFALRENDGEYKHMYSPVSIIFRDSNGKTYQFEPDGVENYCAFVQSKSKLQGIARLLEEGNFDVLMKYNMYNEPHSMTWKSYMRPNMFKKSIDKFLN